MNIGELAVLVEAGSSGERRVGIAVDIMRRFAAKGYSGHITGIGVLPASWNERASEPRDCEVMLTPEGGLLEARREQHGQAFTDPDSAILGAERMFRDAADGLIADWRVVGHGAATEMIRYARLADLTVLGQIDPFTGAPQAGFTPDEIILEAGSPVLVVPCHGEFGVVGKRVMIAWDGSKEAARALHSALPLLATADAVTVLGTGVHEHEAATACPPPDRVLEYLTYHGVEAFVSPTTGPSNSVSDALLSRCADLGIDLMVAGYYYHSRLREAIFGGLMSELLGKMTVPILMAN